MADDNSQKLMALKMPPESSTPKNDPINNIKKIERYGFVFNL